jgi:hypothetical protein
MFGNALAYLLRKFAAPFDRHARVTRRPARVRLGMEALGDRIVPASLEWTNAGGDGLFGNVANWRDYNTWVAATTPPAHGDSLFFGSYTSADCLTLYGFVGSSLSVPDFASITLDAGYFGTVNVGSAITTGNLTIHGGTLAQDGAMADVVVGGAFEWTGGTVTNSGSPFPNSQLVVSGAGATALIAPAGGGTVDLGSNMTLSGGAVATLREGTINLINDGLTFTISANSGMAADPGQNKKVNLVASSEGQQLGSKIMIEEAGAWVEVRSGTLDNGGRAENKGGRFTLLAGTTAVFDTTTVIGAVENAYFQNGGITELYKGSTLRGERFIVFDGGSLVTVGAGTGPDAATIEILNTFGGVSGLMFKSGDIYINSRSGDHGNVEQPGVLQIVGRVHWTGGTYHPRVSTDTIPRVSDVWHATGFFGIGRESNQVRPTLAPVTLNAESLVDTPVRDHSWLVISSGNRILDDGFHLVFNENAWAIDQLGNPIREWWIRAK